MPSGDACLIDSNILLRISNVHGVGLLLTINVWDFRRFDDLRILIPAELSGTL
jgi:hypothetical protein